MIFLSDSSGIRIQNHLVRRWTINHLAKLSCCKNCYETELKDINLLCLQHTLFDTVCNIYNLRSIEFREIRKKDILRKKILVKLEAAFSMTRCFSIIAFDAHNSKYIRINQVICINLWVIGIQFVLIWK